jgi:hypothetical protein
METIRIVHWWNLMVSVSKGTILNLSHSSLLQKRKRLTRLFNLCPQEERRLKANTQDLRQTSFAIT